MDDILSILPKPTMALKLSQQQQQQQLQRRLQLQLLQLQLQLQQQQQQNQDCCGKCDEEDTQMGSAFQNTFDIDLSVSNNLGLYEHCSQFVMNGIDFPDNYSSELVFENSNLFEFCGVDIEEMFGEPMMNFEMSA